MVEEIVDNPVPPVKNDKTSKLVLCLLFDGASNIMESADMIQKHFPSCVVVHVVEWVYSLIVEKNFMLYLCSNMKIVRNIDRIFVMHVICCFVFVSQMYELDVANAPNLYCHVPT